MASAHAAEEDVEVSKGLGDWRELDSVNENSENSTPRSMQPLPTGQRSNPHSVAATVGMSELSLMCRSYARPPR